VSSDDTVLELGCQRGETTRALIRAAKTVVGVDIDRKEFTRGGTALVQEKEEPNFKFLQTSSWSNELQSDHGQFTVIYVDICGATGNDLVFDGIALVQQLLTAFQSSLRYLIIRSKRLSIHACAFRNAHAVVAKLDPWLSNIRDPDRLKVLCAVGVQQYRSTIPVVVHKGYKVLEIGAHFGSTAKLLHDQVGPTGMAVGVDIGKKALARASAKFTDVRFDEASAWDTHKLVAICAEYDAIYIDIGGVSGYDGLIEGVALVTQLMNAFKPTLKVVVIKSRALRDFANTYRCSEEFLYDLATGHSLVGARYYGGGHDGGGGAAGGGADDS
jgi:SAM-dependent methyltransferase